MGKKGKYLEYKTPTVKLLSKNKTESTKFSTVLKKLALGLKSKIFFHLDKMVLVTLSNLAVQYFDRQKTILIKVMHVAQWD